ncbi:UNVERIFIED_CONTAM: hypothetical protein Slati_3282600 [Sesamum latifolium]|uniref:Uncharacterized protein n=1 Tax=Sesamum latifolium TaxID=2727402 RepID=A0AAW2V1Z6_9LAMI
MHMGPVPPPQISSGPILSPSRPLAGQQYQMVRRTSTISISPARLRNRPDHNHPPSSQPLRTVVEFPAHSSPSTAPDCRAFLGAKHLPVRHAAASSYWSDFLFHPDKHCLARC